MTRTAHILQPESLRNALVAISAAAALAPVSAQAAGTQAGVEIVNVASASYQVEGGPTVHLTSNEARVRIGEILDVVVAVRDPGPVGVAAPDAGRALAFTVTNTGNGRERFSLAALTNLSGDQFDPAFRRIAIDSDGDGAYTPGVDVDYVAGAEDPEFAPDQTRVVFIVSDAPAGLADGDLGRAQLTATAVTGHGRPGTLFAGLGDGGVDALAGRSSARADAAGAYVAATASVRLVKTQTVLDPAGGEEPYAGAVVTYTLRAELSGEGAVSGARVVDAIPAGTTYQAGSLRLDGAPLSDAADADAGQFANNEITVGLDRLTAPTAHAVTFQVRIDAPGA